MIKFIADAVKQFGVHNVYVCRLIHLIHTKVATAKGKDDCYYALAVLHQQLGDSWKDVLTSPLSKAAKKTVSKKFEKNKKKSPAPGTYIQFRRSKNEYIPNPETEEKEREEKKDKMKEYTEKERKKQLKNALDRIHHLEGLVERLRNDLKQSKKNETELQQQLRRVLTAPKPLARKDLIGALSDEWWSKANGAVKWKPKYECMMEVSEIVTRNNDMDIADHEKSGDFLEILVKWMAEENHVFTRIAIFRLMPKLIEAFPVEILNKYVPSMLETILTKQWMEKKAALLNLVTPTLIPLWLKVCKFHHYPSINQ